LNSAAIMHFGQHVPDFKKLVSDYTALFLFFGSGARLNHDAVDLPIGSVPQIDVINMIHDKIAAHLMVATPARTFSELVASCKKFVCLEGIQLSASDFILPESIQDQAHIDEGVATMATISQWGTQELYRAALFTFLARGLGTVQSRTHTGNHALKALDLDFLSNNSNGSGLLPPTLGHLAGPNVYTLQIVAPKFNQYTHLSGDRTPCDISEYFEFRTLNEGVKNNCPEALDKMLLETLSGPKCELPLLQHLMCDAPTSDWISITNAAKYQLISQPERANSSNVLRLVESALSEFKQILYSEPENLNDAQILSSDAAFMRLKKISRVQETRIEFRSL